MTRNILRHGLALAFVLAAGASLADTLPPARVAERSTPAADVAASGAMTRDEFMAMAGQVFDMAVREGRVTSAQLLEYRRALRSQ